MTASNPYSASPVSPVYDYEISLHEQIDYGQSVRFIFDNPNWIVNVLFLIGCLLAASVIPLLPGLVVIGYQFEVIEALLVRPRHAYPDFKVDRILQYLLRGLYPLLVAMVGFVVMIPVVLLAIGIPVGIMIALLSVSGEDLAWVVALIMVPLIICSYLLTAFLGSLAIIPMVLRSGLAQDIGAGFDLAFVKDFARKMWKDVIWVGLFMIAVGLVAQFVGLLMLCIGVIFTSAMIYLVQAHLGMQLYRVYLSRGGEKVPLKPADAVVY